MVGAAFGFNNKYFEMVLAQSAANGNVISPKIRRAEGRMVLSQGDGLCVLGARNLARQGLLVMV